MDNNAHNNATTQTSMQMMNDDADYKQQSRQRTTKQMTDNTQMMNEDADGGSASGSAVAVRWR
jgi:hypothetical protein